MNLSIQPFLRCPTGGSRDVRVSSAQRSGDQVPDASQEIDAHAGWKRSASLLPIARKPISAFSPSGTSATEPISSLSS